MCVNNKKINPHEEIFNSSAESIIVANQQGEIIMANPQSEHMFGFESGELVGEKVEVLIPNNSRKHHSNHMESYNRKPETRKMGIGRDLTGLRKDGSEFPIEVSLNPTQLGDLPIVIAFVIDITERKKMEIALENSEKQLVKYAAELEKRVNDRTQELASTIKELEKSNKKRQKEIIERKKAEQEVKKSLQKEKDLNELKSRFVSMASHEFRTPLSTILSSASLISKYENSTNKEKVDKHINRIKSNVSEMTGILNDFLSLDKLEEGKVQYQRQNINLMVFVTETVEELRLLTKQDQVIVLETDKANYDISIDKSIVKHIIANLISNAIKYSQSGDTITVTLNSDKQNIYIKVKDEGIGIPEAEQKHLFERFFRAANATNIQGTGLGLNLVKKYIDLIGGAIQYESSEQNGSIFIVTFYKKHLYENDSFN